MVNARNVHVAARTIAFITRKYGRMDGDAKRVEDAIQMVKVRMACR